MIEPEKEDKFVMEGWHEDFQDEPSPEEYRYRQSLTGDVD